MLKKLFQKYAHRAAAAVTTATALTHPAAAQDLTSVANNVSGSFNSISNLLVGAAGLVGIGFVVFGAKDLVTATQSSGRDAKHTHGFVKIGVAAILFSIGVAINVGKGTLFASNTNSSVTPNTISVNNGTP